MSVGELGRQYVRDDAERVQLVHAVLIVENLEDHAAPRTLAAVMLTGQSSGNSGYPSSSRYAPVGETCIILLMGGSSSLHGRIIPSPSTIMQIPDGVKRTIPG